MSDHLHVKRQLLICENNIHALTKSETKKYINPLFHSSRVGVSPSKRTNRERDGEKEKPGCQSSTRSGETLIVSEIERRKRKRIKLRAFFFSTLTKRLCFGSTQVVEPGNEGFLIRTFRLTGDVS